MTDESTLGELCDIDVGPAFPSSSFSDTPEGPRLVRGDNVAQGRLRWDEIRFWPAHLAETYEKFDLAAGDAILAMDRPWIAAGLKQAVVRNSDLPALLVQRVARLRAKPPHRQPFIRWLLASPDFTSYIRAVSTGSTIPHISQRQISDYPVPRVPTPADQDAIAEVLGALDDKVESNRRLDQVTQSLIHCEVEAWRSRTENWSTTSFGAFADVFGGATPKTKTPEYWGGDLPWVTPSDVTALPTIYLSSTGRTLTPEGLASCSAELHPAGTIFMTSRATIGAFAIPQMPCATNQGFIAVRPAAPEHRWFLLDEMVRRVPEMLDRANGSTFLELSRSNFKAMELLVPEDREALWTLHEILDPLHQRAAHAAEESTNLAALRDALLPELLSGRLRVPEAEDLVADAV